VRLALYGHPFSSYTWKARMLDRVFDHYQAPASGSPPGSGDGRSREGVGRMCPQYGPYRPVTSTGVELLVVVPLPSWP
jgi:hypothetical protein